MSFRSCVHLLEGVAPDWIFFRKIVVRATQYDTTAGGRILLRRDLRQTAWARLNADDDMRKLLTNWRRRLVLCVQQGRRRLQISGVTQPPHVRA